MSTLGALLSSLTSAFFSLETYNYEGRHQTIYILRGLDWIYFELMICSLLPSLLSFRLVGSFYIWVLKLNHHLRIINHNRKWRWGKLHVTLHNIKALNSNHLSASFIIKTWFCYSISFLFNSCFAHSDDHRVNWITYYSPTG